MLGVKEAKEGYELQLHTHEGQVAMCCEGETDLVFTRDLLKKWTGLNRQELDHAFRYVNLGSTYNLLATLPRTVTVSKKEVVVQTGGSSVVDSLNVCRLLLHAEHPLDR